MMICVGAGTSKIKTIFNATSLFKYYCNNISTISIQDSTPPTNNVMEITNCGDSSSVPPKRCICVGPTDNNFVAGTDHNCTSTIITANNTGKYCRQTTCKDDSLTCPSDSNGMYVNLAVNWTVRMYAATLQYSYVCTLVTHVTSYHMLSNLHTYVSNNVGGNTLLI